MLSITWKWLEVAVLLYQEHRCEPLRFYQWERKGSRFSGTEWSSDSEA